jgi:phosphatidylserine/phosphatidylglycerophosphate/cardiolipin synthase-like enzyme
VHNKGFVIDGKTVVVSSQNFWPAGVYNNRDAGLILESVDIAQYFGPIFDADWRFTSALGSRKISPGRDDEEKKAGCKKGEESGQRAAKKVIV